MSVKTDDLSLNFLFKTCENTKRQNENSNADGETGYGEVTNEGNEAEAVPRTEMSAGDKEEKAHLYSSSCGRMAGKKITSLIFVFPIRSMVSRSIPKPTPPVGGIPISTDCR